MAVLGLYTTKQVEAIKSDYEKEIKEIIELDSKIIDSQCLELRNLRKKTVELNENLLKAVTDLKEKENEINVLRFMLTVETDKKIKRLETIASKTKKFRIKKKCESRIIDYEMRKLAYEKGRK